MKKQGNQKLNDNLNKKEVFHLQLFVTGASPNSLRAIENLKNICNEHLIDCYQLEIIDVYQQPIKAHDHQLVALPMMIKLSPLPVRKLIGDMSDKTKVLRGLGLINTE